MAKTMTGGGGREARIKARTATAPIYLPAVNRQVGPINFLGPQGVEGIRKVHIRVPVRVTAFGSYAGVGSGLSQVCG
jgi:hypothetical protein